MSAMNRFVAGVLSVIAAGVLSIAYLLAFPRTAPDAAPLSMGSPVSAVDAWGRPLGGSVPGGGVAGAPAQAMSAATFVTPSGQVWTNGGAAAYPVAAYPVAAYGADSVALARPVPAVETVGEVVEAPRRVTRQTVRREPRRDWKKTALIIGGTTAAGAGIGGIVGGKKGALIGAAIGGGASTIYQTTR